MQWGQGKTASCKQQALCLRDSPFYVILFNFTSITCFMLQGQRSPLSATAAVGRTPPRLPTSCVSYPSNLNQLWSHAHVVRHLTHPVRALDVLRGGLQGRLVFDVHPHHVQPAFVSARRPEGVQVCGGGGVPAGGDHRSCRQKSAKKKKKGGYLFHLDL